MNMSSAQIERNKTKEQLEEEKKISLSIRIKPLAIDNLSIDKLKAKATELWDQIVKLETEKYDLEERQKRQDYDVSTYHATLSSCLNYHIIIISVLTCVSQVHFHYRSQNLRFANCFPHFHFNVKFII